jgi:hypothetical protein
LRIHFDEQEKIMKLKAPLIFMLSACLTSAFGQVQSPARVFCGGGEPLSDAGYRVRGTLGQTAAGATAVASFKHGAGFWRTWSVLFTGVPDNSPLQMPVVYQLFQNYPNPFNPSSVIGYAVPEISEVTISVCDVRGKRVETLFKGTSVPGYHEVVFSPGRFASGMYLYVMSARSARTNRTFCDVKKATCVR